MFDSHSSIKIAFWLFAILIAYSYVIYAPLIWLLARVFGRWDVAPVTHKRPSVSLLIAAYNEQDVIEGRIRNALASDYPKDLLEIVVACDGCDDGTIGIIKRFESQGVRLVNYSTRRGKSTVLNETIPTLRGEIVVFSDANTATDRDAISNLVRWFDDDSIGAVCGRLVISDPVTGRNADSLYWKYETFLKKCESRLGALLGSNGAIYAMRRRLYQPIPAGTLVDDFVIPLLAKQRTGCGIVYDASAVARELSPNDVASEFHRRSRIGAGGFQSIVLLWRLLNPRRGWVAMTFFSHKILRWLCPFFMIGLLATNALLLESLFYQWTAAAQLLFYAVSALAAWLPPGARAFKPLRLTTMFTAMNAALFVGFFRWLLSDGSGAWRRTQR